MDISIEDFPRICRLCMRHCNLQPLRTLEEKTKNSFKTITKIELSETEILPRNICKSCIGRLKDLSEFIDICIANNNLLESISQCSKESNTISIESNSITDCGTGFELVTELAENETGNAITDPDSLNIHFKFNPKCRSDDSKCHICNESFYPKYKLTTHLKSHELEKSYRCPECFKSFMFAENLRRHALTHKGVKPFICKLCGKSFLRKRSLDEHTNFHLGKTPYICVFCGKGFARSTHHAAHVYHVHNVHSKNTPKLMRKYTEKRVHLSIPCKTCGKVFASRSGCSSESFTCPHCSKAFKKKALLTNHISSHCREKPHRCNICPKSFMSPSHLIVHKRTHSGEKPYLCPECGKQLAQPQTLKVHMRQHSGETPFVCSFCDKAYRDSSNLKRHIKRHHKEMKVSCEKGKEASESDGFKSLENLMNG
ncbi:hypothetical protein JTB14_004472 [Gonioctena quinquepunctata]|nr:hypothetical protein JTB14_004472 [Gonioctena quinquepunctata]